MSLRWRSAHNATASLTTAALLTAAPLMWLDLPRGLRAPWITAHVAVSLALCVSLPAQLLAGRRVLFRLRSGSERIWLNGWFGRLLLPAVLAAVGTGLWLQQAQGPGARTMPALAHQAAWQVLIPTLLAHAGLSLWVRRRR
ncbi:MAG: hypothetical protein H6702_19110 [Myxococcales bacterium]|nr:hypothetical protein [Myxococcales bacterium]